VNIHSGYVFRVAYFNKNAIQNKFPEEQGILTLLIKKILLQKRGIFVQFTYLLITFFLLFDLATTKKQELVKPELYYPFFGKDMGCENNYRKLISLKAISLVEAKNSRYVIAVLHMSIGEKRKSLQYRRLHNLKSVMKDSPNFLISTGSEVKELSRYKIYVEGKLVDEVLINKNQDFCVSCCEGNEAVYPDIDLQKRRLIRKP